MYLSLFLSHLPKTLLRLPPFSLLALIKLHVKFTEEPPKFLIPGCQLRIRDRRPHTQLIISRDQLLHPLLILLVLGLNTLQKYDGLCECLLSFPQPSFQKSVVMLHLLVLLL